MTKAPHTFNELGLSQWLIEAIEHLEYAAPYPIQYQAIPHIIKGKDILGIAKTGSGKTASYILPLLQRLDSENWTLPNRHIAALILVPTRELALQIYQVCDMLTKHARKPIKTMAVYGGISINPQMIKMQGVQVLIATPGRLIDLINQKALSLSALKILVLDEADKMLNLGFKAEMDALLIQMPAKRQNLLFSATLSKSVADVNAMILNKPVVIKIENEEIPIELIKQHAFQVSEERKGPFLRYLIKSRGIKQALVFTSSIYKADLVSEKLRKNGIFALATHGKKSNEARINALKDFKEGKLKVLVSTDLLSRGIDIDFLPCVINYELPRSPKEFIHRIGRTGRAEQMGEAFSLIAEDEKQHYSVIQKKMKLWIPLEETDAIDLHGY